MFVEDMTEEQLASAMRHFTYSGALRSSGANAPSQYFTAALCDLYESMDKTSSSFPSIILLQFLHMAFPQFAEKDDQGQYVQQLMRVLQQKLETQEPEIPIQMSDCDGGTAASSTKKNFIDQFFGVVFDTTYPLRSEVKYLATGIRLRLQEEMTKFSQRGSLLTPKSSSRSVMMSSIWGQTRHERKQRRRAKTVYKSRACDPARISNSISAEYYNGDV
ncbi:hypothetical protein Q7C36_004229 [Tachysurus vachellii]|uniref:ubiquitinyl hydrolase 1 n=1 Tax=Tachysurus vachellii TaxID=175792 RepID=A0AA88NPM3_TACVA|nr:hypothetical protein Q7C36_004229 [Tachysurus vachellii]